jgi:hypothetical protein
MSLPHPYVEWTDEIGAARIVCYGATFMNWAPDWVDVGDTQFAVGDGALYFLAYRTDHIAYFEIQQIANTEVTLALRLKSWIQRGGACVVTTLDSESHVYNCRQAPLGATSNGANATMPAFTFSDPANLEYMLALWVKNIDTTPRPMPYTPVAYSRPSALALSPSPITTPFPGSGADVTATVTDALGHGVAGIHLSAVSSDSAAFTTALTAVTDGSGVATFHVTPVAGGTGNLTISDGGALSAVDVVTIAAGVYGISSPAPILWLKPDSVSGSAVDGLRVATWPDDSPNHWDMTAMVSNGGALAAKWDAAEGALRFVSGDPCAYENAAFDSFASCSEYTLFVVKKSASAGGCVMSTSSSDWWEGYQVSSRYRTDLGGFGDSSYYTFVDDLAVHVHETRYKGSLSGSARLLQLLDSVNETLTQFGIPTSFASGGGVCIGHGSGLGFFNGWIKEVLAFPGRLTDAQADSVAGQLRTKYP